MRIALGLEYNGHHFFGWQSQINLPSVQVCLEDALSKITNEPIKVFCAGRTDAKVHAVGQVVHFDTQAVRGLRAWTLGTNTFLPHSVAVKWAQEVDSEFHARFSAVSRCYRYIILNRSIRSAISAGRVTWHHRALDVERMQRASQYLLGEHDFSSLRSSECQSKTTKRKVRSITVFRQGDYVMIEIEANAFLHHMVRNIAGVLMQIGEHQQPPEWMLDVLAAKDRRCAAATAAPDGLYLYQVRYPEVYQFPLHESDFLFI
ncbi:MAG: tRNA pseudouridine(38-40) synthase TruA [Gammaproteobacteria bacterium]